MSTQAEARVRADTIAYALHGNLYLNITSRCTLRCAFCSKFNGIWTVQNYYPLRLTRAQEPSVAQIIAAVSNARAYNEIVFCGLGEPTLRLYDALEAGHVLRRRGATVRINTDGLANLVYGRDVTPDLEGNIDALSISLNAQNAATYNRHCRPTMPGSYQAMLDFARRAREFVPDIRLTAIEGLEGVDIPACAAIAGRLGVRFHKRVLDDVG
ncbi:MAG TPA: TatD family nuclease-associated radical SAM protein [Acidiferrobacterales bacterium]|nr:TatD family nuclease-associated radical SAM protein [Acidiferrobacterales bacterium]